MSFKRQPTTRPQLDFSDSPSRTEQTHKDEVSIHKIMKKYEKTGVVTHVNEHKGQYMDMSGALDYQDAQNLIANAKSMFETVPSHIRRDFDNNPGKFVDFMQDEANRDAIAAYGFDTSHLPPPKESPPESPPVAPVEPPAE